MAKKLIIILANTNTGSGADVGEPIYQATVAAGMAYMVEVFCAGSAVRILKPGVASALTVKACDSKTVHDFIREAHAAGVKFFCCSPGLDFFGMHSEADLIPECSGVVGAAHLIEEIMSDEVRILTY